jgi:hypothetical protein
VTDKTYKLTLILNDHRGTTKVKLTDVAEGCLLKSPLLANLIRMHELFMPETEEKGAERE